MKLVVKIALGVVLGMILLMGGCAVLLGSASSGGYNSDNSYTVKVFGTARSASIDYPAGTNGDDDAQADVRLPWSRTFTDNDSFVDLVLSAQNDGQSGKVTCEFLQGSKVLDKVTSSGAYSIASCSYSN